MTIDRWFWLRCAVVGGVLAPMIYYHNTAERLDLTLNMLYFALECLIAVSLSFTMFVIELYYKTGRNAQAAKGQ